MPRLIHSTGNTTVETSENCEVTVSFGGDDGKSVSVVVNQQVVESSVESLGGGGPPSGGPLGGGPPGGRKGAASSECYDCDGLVVSCEGMALKKMEEVIIIAACSFV